jgi:hypothetical protein
VGLSPRLHLPLLILAALLLALALLGPYRTVPFTRADGVTVPLLAPDRLSPDSDVWDYLQLGRRLYQGHGLTSRFTYVPFLPESVRGSTPPTEFPLFWRPPGFPVLVAAAFLVSGGPHPQAFLALQALSVLLLAVATYLLGRRVLSPGWAAMAALWTVLSPVALGAAAPMVATTFFAAWITLVLAALLVAERPWAQLGAGALLGLAGLLRLETWVLAPGFLLAFVLARRGKRLAGLGRVVAAAAVTAAFWPIRLAVLTGDPFYNASSLLYHATGAFPSWTASRTLAVREMDPLGFVFHHFGDVAVKSALDLARFARDLVFLPSLFLMPFWVVGVLRPARERRGRALALGALVAGVVLLLVLAPMEYSRRFLGPAVPVLAVVAGLAMAQLPRFRRVSAVAATGVGVVTLVMALAGRPADGRAGAAARELDRVLARPEASALEHGAVALSDVPTLYAWIWDRPAVGAPVAGDLPEVRRLLGGEVVGIFTCDLGIDGFVEGNLLQHYAAAGGRVVGGPCPALVLFPPAGAPGR